MHTYYKLTGSNKLEPKDPKVLITAKVMFSVRPAHTKLGWEASDSASLLTLLCGSHIPDMGLGIADDAQSEW